MGRPRFEVNSRGISQVCKSPGMVSVLAGHAARVAADANAAAEGCKASLGVERFAVPPYKGLVRTLDKTAVGMVAPETSKGEEDQARNKSLSRQMHKMKRR